MGLYLMLSLSPLRGTAMRETIVRVVVSNMAPAVGVTFSFSSTTGFIYVYDMKSLRPAGRIKIGTNVQLETATTDTADEKIYLADSTENAVVIVDAKTNTFEKVMNVGLFPWGTHIMDSKDNYCH